MRYAEGEERHLEADPNQQAGPHHLLGAEDVRERSAEPRSHGRGDSVGREDQGDPRRTEVKVHQEGRKKACFHTVANHEKEQTQVAEG